MGGNGSNGSAMLERRLRAMRNPVLPVLEPTDQAGFISACCQRGSARKGCYACSSLVCTCSCHRRCIPVGKDRILTKKLVLNDSH